MSEEDSTQSIYGLRPQLRTGDRLADRFVVVQFLARGGMGEVYEVADEHLQGKHCALKRLRPDIAADPAVQARFVREVLLAREVNHLNVCPTYDIFRVDEPGGPLLFLTMKLLRGESLAERLKRSVKLDPQTVLLIAKQMGAALDAAHAAGVIHRDFKPGNVMLETTGSEVRVSITDFGLSRLYESDSTMVHTGKISGTRGYIAPELWQGQIASPAADVYAFGVVLYEMLTGVRPQGELGKSELVRPSKLVEGLSRRWDRLVQGCLEPDPAKRFQSAGEALASLDDAKSVSRPVAVRRRPSRRLAVGAALASVLAVIAALLGWSRIDAVLHPLPPRRFVALMAWPPEKGNSTAPLLRTVLDSIGNRLARAEAAHKNFTVIAPGDAGQAAPKALADVVSMLGANLVLGTSLQVEGGGYLLRLRVFDAATGAVLRKNDTKLTSAATSQLAERASTVAAELLDVPKDLADLKDQDEIAKLAPQDFRLLGEAEDLRSQPNDSGLDAAIEKYQKILESEPRFALGYADLSLAYSRKFQLGKDRAFLTLAENNATLSLQYNPQSAKGVLATAVFDLESGNAQRAMDGFARALRLDPGNPQILIFKARVFLDLNRLPEEESVYREIIRQRPNYWPAYNQLGNNLYRQTRYQEAADAFAEAAAVAPRVALPLANEGTMYLLLNQEKNAEDAFRKSLDRAPNEFAYSNLGSILFKRSNYQGAIEYYGKALEQNPKNHRTWRNLADCYAMLGDSRRQMESYAKASEALTEALKVNPKPGANWVTLAFYQAKLGRRADAEADLRIAEERGLDRRAQFTKAQTLAVLGRKEEALLLVLKCVDEGISTVDVDLALDLKEVRSDPRYLGHIAARGKTR